MARLTEVRSRIAAALLLLVCQPAAAGVIHVPAEAATLHDAMDAAVAGDTILVAPGEFVVTRPLSFLGKGVLLVSEGGSGATTIRMSDPPADAKHGSVILFEGDEPETAVIEGFTITGGRGSAWGDSPSQMGGGGVLCRGGARPAIRRCRIAGNRAQNGGGVMTDSGSTAAIEECMLESNLAQSEGGGILWVAPGLRPVLRDSTIRGNAAGAGGGLFCLFGASPDITGCLIEGNFAVGPGGGLCCLVDSSPAITACTFMGNSGSGGGAIALETGSDSPVLVNCLLEGNLAFIGGALIANSGASPLVLNCTLTGNGALDDLGGLACEESEPRVVNSIVWGNSPESVCGEVSSSLTGDPAFVRIGTFDLERSRSATVGGVDRSMPDFVVDPGDYRLLAGSRAIDRGESAGAPAADLDGRSRPCGGNVDIGAYEFCPVMPAVPFLRGDANADGKANISDPSFVLNFLFLGGPGPTCLRSADTNGSGKLDVSDAVYQLNFQFLGGPALPPPSAACGDDPGLSELPCAAFAPCGEGA